MGITADDEPRGDFGRAGAAGSGSRCFRGEGSTTGVVSSMAGVAGEGYSGRLREGGVRGRLQRYWG